MSSPPRGLIWFCGKTQVKKTTHAVALAHEVKDATGDPILVIDSQGAWNFREWPRAQDRRGLYEAVYGRRQDCAMTPADENDVEAVYRTVRQLGRCTVLLDEASFWISKRKLPTDISRALRAWAHCGVLFLFTTQRIGDIHPTALAIDCEIRVYQTLTGPDSDRLWDDYRIKLEEVQRLPVGSYITIRNGEVQRGGDGCPRVTVEAA